ncbi:helix-turn-helix domain-containing protein [Parvularcula maris]|uniref:Helix-turn-helix transcriptional regulator n=1 Tax=Parvularcula maris TaxID=2965077 RepID=A0A9X2L6X9_9PROT|nr:AraC family transcriptional regulator [Parvularcula maris]MCQ8184076.1 helix-turn-helix transcriptional regulator [Parvularcula maris]
MKKGDNSAESTYRATSADPALAGYARRLMTADIQAGAGFRQQVWPTGFFYIGVILEGRITARWEGAELTLTGGEAHFSGQIGRQTARLETEGPLRHILLELNPDAPYRLFGHRGARSVGRVLDIGSAATGLPEEARRQVLAAASEDSTGRAAEKLQAAMKALIEKAKPAPEPFRSACDLWEEEGGRLPVSMVADRLGTTQRTMERQFADLLGLTPKTYARIVQMANVAGALQRGEPPVLAALATEMGFADQAHFTRVMRAFFSQSPRDFLGAEDDLLASFVARSR